MTDKEKMAKIRKMLGNRYHLCESLEYGIKKEEKIGEYVFVEKDTIYIIRL